MLLRPKRLAPRQSRLLLGGGLLMLSSGLAMRSLGPFGHGAVGHFSEGLLIGAGVTVECVALYLGRKPR